MIVSSGQSAVGSGQWAVGREAMFAPTHCVLRQLVFGSASKVQAAVAVGRNLRIAPADCPLPTADSFPQTPRTAPACRCRGSHGGSSGQISTGRAPGHEVARAF